MSIWAQLQHFRASEFEPHADKMSEVLLRKLDDARHIAGVPIHVTSGFRSGDDGAHGDGDAVDISDNKRGDDISSRWRFLVLHAAYAAGFLRIGDYDKHLHLDVSESRDQEVAWLGKSK